MSSETREVLHDMDAHPVHGTRTYWIIGAYLFVLTALEIAAFYIEDSLGEVKVELGAIRGHMVTVQTDVGNLYSGQGKIEARLSRIERRLELADEPQPVR